MTKSPKLRKGPHIDITTRANKRVDGKASSNLRASRNGKAKGKVLTKKTAQGDTAATYDAFKEFEGRRYTSMKIGRSHKWYYDQEKWREKKITPDQWEINYAVTKRRAGKSPEGSGVPVGTGITGTSWLIRMSPS